ncbi:MAG: outer membrane beta-barrel protein [Cellvibrionaceae bacterium]|nr:outer membrane beta-barrel protein [Cellvibrionaceae bacterium]
MTTRTGCIGHKAKLILGEKSVQLATLPLAIAMALPVNALEPAAVDMGPFRLVPTLGISNGYDSNLFLTDGNEKESWVTIINPQVQFIAENGNDRYSITYGVNHGIVQDSRDDDYTDHSLRGDINLELNSRNYLDISAAFTKNHEPRGTGANQGNDATSNPVPAEYDERTFDVAYTYGGKEADGRLKVAAGFLDKEYTNFLDQNAARDRKNNYVAGTFYYRVAPKTQAIFEIKRKKIDYDLTTSPLDSTETFYLVGATWEATAQTTGTVKVGLAEKDFDSNLQDDDNVSWEVSVDWAPIERSVFTLATSKLPEETDGTGSYIDRTSLSVSWMHNWSDRFSTRLTAGRRDGEYIGNAREDEEDTWGISLMYNMRRWLDLSLNYDYSDRSSNISGLDYDKNTIYLRADVSL